MLINLPLRKLIDELVLRRSVDHAPPLLSHLAHFIENRNILVVVDEETNQGHHHEGARPPDPCAAMHDWYSILLEALQELIEEVVDPPLPISIGNFSVDPVIHLEMSNDSSNFIVGVGQLQFSDFDCFLLVEVEFLEKLDLVLFLPEGRLRKGVYGVVPVAFQFVLLNDVAEHKNGVHFVLLHHPPEIVEGELRNGGLGRNRLLPFDIDEIGIYVIVDVLFL